MSGDESFLARWSRRKRNVTAQSNAEKGQPQSATEMATPGPNGPEDRPPITLPPIESIESASDIKAFLAPSVPLELTRAALRRAWTADPAIRDFIGLSENAWDFNASAGLPGFGSLDLQDVRRLVAKVLSEPKAADPAQTAAALSDHSATPADTAEAGPAVATAALPENIAAPQHRGDEGKVRGPGSHRRHGGALPQ
ncbi:MAG: DUF3306 domain-containing protein [Stellaceae bacterium]